MRLFVMMILMVVSCGCSQSVENQSVNPTAANDVEDGGTVKNPDREKAQELLTAVSKTQSVDEEKQAISELATWLKDKGYKIQVEEAEGGKHTLSCNYFPPVTPWVSHTFHDLKNLELLPQ